METDFATFLTSVENFVKVLGPFAGVYFAARVIISYQKDLLGSLRDANLDLRSQIKEQDDRIDALEGKINDMANQQVECDRKNNHLDLQNRVLIAAVRNAGIRVPEVPETYLPNPEPVQPSEPSLGESSIVAE